MRIPLVFCLVSATLAQKFAPVKPPKGTQVDSPPQLGFGTWQLKGKNATDAVAAAIEAGYRHIDAAKIYTNQKEVGAGIKEGLKRAGIDRKDLWVTSKLWGDRHGDVEGGLTETLGELGLEYIDLYLVHWPQGNSTGRDTLDYLTAWQNMERVVGKGTRFIGVSNFSPAMIDDVLKNGKVKPKALQVELHPYLQQQKFVDSTFAKGIDNVIAYAPLGNTNPVYAGQAYDRSGTASPKIMDMPLITAIAKERQCTSAQVVLAWNMKRGVIVIPKASRVAHVQENLATEEKCKLQDEDVRKISSMGDTVRLLYSPCKGFGYKCFEGLFCPKCT